MRARSELRVACTGEAGSTAENAASSTPSV
jgi:hypothetical protein